MIRVVPIDAYFNVYTLALSVLLDMLARLSLNRLRVFSAATALRRYSGQWPFLFLFKGQEPLLGQLRSLVEADMRLRCCRNLWICNSVQFILEVKDTIRAVLRTFAILDMIYCQGSQTGKWKVKRHSGPPSTTFSATEWLKMNRLSDSITSQSV